MRTDPATRLFLQNLDNIAFVQGRSRDFALQGRPRFPCLVVALFVFTALGLGIWLAVFNSMGPSCAPLEGPTCLGALLQRLFDASVKAGIPALVFLALAGLAFWELLRYGRRTRRLREEGRLITGHVTRCTQEHVSDSEGDEYEMVRIDYSFSSIVGSVAGTAQMLPRDLAGQSMPEPGTPVAILYADAGLWELL